MAVVTGLRHGDEVSALLVAGGQAWQATTPWLDVASWGAGDLFAALFLGNFLNSSDPKWALSRAMASTYGVLRETLRLGADALALAAAQAEIGRPSEVIGVYPIWAV
jgi:pyridoxine kinase